MIPLEQTGRTGCRLEARGGMEKRDIPAGQDGAVDIPHRIQVEMEQRDSRKSAVFDGLIGTRPLAAKYGGQGQLGK